MEKTNGRKMEMSLTPLVRPLWFVGERPALSVVDKNAA